MPEDMTLAALGEKKIISDIIRLLPIDTKGFLQLNDDAQVIHLQSHTSLCISTDRTPTNLRALCLGVMSLFEYGRYCVISNLSDIAAMGAFPIGFLLNIAASPSMLVNDFKEVMNGIVDALNEYNISLLGGDTKESSDLNMVGIALGQGYNENILTRSCAKSGDYLFVSKGYLGLTPAAFSYFDHQDTLAHQISDDEKSDLIASLTKIRARFDEASILANSGVCTSCMDNTDGLYSSFIELANASKIGLDVDLSNIQIHQAVHTVSEGVGSVPVQKLIISAGADFKLLGTVSNVIPDISERFQIIGRVTDKYKTINIKGMSDNDLKTVSKWNHFT